MQTMDRNEVLRLNLQESEVSINPTRARMNSIVQ